MSIPATSAIVPDRLRIALAASDRATGERLAALIVRIGHELVPLSASPDAILTDGPVSEAFTAPAVALGAVAGECAGLLPSTASAAQVDAALRAVAAGLTIRAIPRPDRNFEALPEEPPIVLTPREIEVLSALGDGLTNKEVARLLGISPHTVKFHVESLFRKLGASSRAAAVAKGMRQQIVEL